MVSDQRTARELAAMEDLEQQVLDEEENILAPCEPGQFRVFRRIATNPENHLAISFSGGGVPGLVGNCALLGILEELDIIGHVKETWGTSAGSIVAAALATEVGRDEVYRLIERVGKAGPVDVPKWDLIKGVLGFIFRRRIPEGFVRGKGFHDTISDGMKVRTFEEATIPLRIITCTDDGNAQKVIHRKGDILQAIMASMCLPGIMYPVKDWKGKPFGYFDGGVVENTPLVSIIDDHLRDGRSTQLVVVCTRFSSPAKIKKPQGFMARFLNVLYHFQDMAWRYQKQTADQAANCKYLIVNPHVEVGKMLEFEHIHFDYLLSRKMFKQQLSNAGVAGRFGAG